MMSSPASTSSAGHVPGGSSVNLDEAVLTSKVLLQDKECVLVLVPQKLSCREFASNREGLCDLFMFLCLGVFGLALRGGLAGLERAALRAG